MKNKTGEVMRAQSFERVGEGGLTNSLENSLSMYPSQSSPSSSATWSTTSDNSSSANLLPEMKIIAKSHEAIKMNDSLFGHVPRIEATLGVVTCHL